MSDKSGIEWTDATWNPVAGCSIVSPGCTNCYAMGVAGRMEAISVAHEASHGGDPGPMERYRGTTELTRHGKAVWTGKVNLVPEVLEAPLRWKRPRRIFVNSMSDLFHDGVPDEWIDKVFAVMALCRQHQFQVLTKRPARMRAYLSAPGEGRRLRHEAVVAAAREIVGDVLPEHFAPVGADRTNVWIGASAEDQTRFDERWEELKHCRLGRGPLFVSVEPLLGPLNLRFGTDHCDLCGGTGKLARWPKGKCHVCGGRGRVVINGPSEFDAYYRLDWVIVGGESGKGARPMHPDWVRSLRGQCAAHRVPFFFKQWGEWAAGYDRDLDDPDWRQCAEIKARTPKGQWLNLAGGQGFHGDRVVRVEPIGKKAAGRLLDGVTHDGMPA